MDEAEARSRAIEARRLLTDPLLIEALNAVLAEARDALETCEPADLPAWQARARAARALNSELDRIIIAGPVTEPTVPNDPGVT